MYVVCMCMTSKPKGHNVASTDFAMKCHRCSHEWNYTGGKKPGKYPAYVSVLVAILQLY